MWPLFQEGSIDKHGRFCYECGFFAEWNDFHRLKHGRSGRMSICKPCKNKHRAITRELRQLHDQPAACQGCGDESSKLQLDHDHETLAFRAYLCCRCNLRARRGGWARQTL